MAEKTVRDAYIGDVLNHVNLDCFALTFINVVRISQTFYFIICCLHCGTACFLQCACTLQVYSKSIFLVLKAF